ncbi:hypothetical protein GH714_002613 [Hevea brasiliensis]|uniref:R13L1/DRL21-like LRR repeat region domain-containing protein n=1 Tax=Hevea brasiliensis TaxID=3981 RepID=A0A6A6L003_HEVBR|nr:hypothetical protein GH714_002613 [Hevea brasiliensis]
MLLKGCYNLKKLPSEMQNLINLRHLDIKGVRLYEGMPLGIKDLTSVRTLSDFVAGRSDDVREPILMDNERIDSLAMGWGFQNTPDESRDRDVLDRMKPHENLKKLTMVHYGGTEFPLWVDDPLFHNLVRLKLEDCKNCVTLPHLGLLSSLRNLVIERRKWLILVVSFQRLPLISHLQIEGCRKQELGGGFSSANLMKVYGESFLFPPEEFMQGLRKLEMLTIGRDVRVHPFLSRPRGPCWVLFEGIIENEELLQKGIADSKIEILEFRRCKSLEKLPPWLHSFKSLRELLIEGCARLISLPDAVIYSSLCLEELKIESCDSLISFGRRQLPPTLKWLQISRCQKLQRLMDEEIIDCDPNSSNLQHLKIDDCGSLTFLGKLPPSLKDLVITSFGFDLEIGAKLESIAERFNSTTSLESIKIGYLLILNLYPRASTCSPVSTTFGYTTVQVLYLSRREVCPPCV